MMMLTAGRRLAVSGIGHGQRILLCVVWGLGEQGMCGCVMAMLREQGCLSGRGTGGRRRWTG